MHDGDGDGEGDDVKDDQVYESLKRTVLRGGCSILCIHTMYYIVCITHGDGILYTSQYKSPETNKMYISSP